MTEQETIELEEIIPLQDLVKRNFTKGNIVCKDNWQIAINKKDTIIDEPDFLVISRDSRKIYVNHNAIIKITLDGVVHI